MTKTNKYKIKLFVILIFKYMILIFVPLLLIMGNHKLSLFSIGIIVFISGIISYIFNNVINFNIYYALYSKQLNICKKYKL